MSALLAARVPACPCTFAGCLRGNDKGSIVGSFLMASDYVHSDLLFVSQVISNIEVMQQWCARLRAGHHLFAAIGRFATAARFATGARFAMASRFATAARLASGARLATGACLATVAGSLPLRATTQSFSTASILVCQPAPVSRNTSNTSGESRIVMRSFVSAALGRHAASPATQQATQ